VAIQSFGNTETESFFVSGKIRKGTGWVKIKNIAKRKLDMLDFALLLSDLKVPPGNKLEVLRGDLKGFHSIRINRQWRIIFRWFDSGPQDVEITDYH
jgi:proteic killer suppression protein